MKKIIAIINQKGGVGKTTTAVNVSAYLAKAGKTVLLIDSDPQGNTTSGLGFAKEETGPTLYNLLLGSESFANTVKKTTQAKLFLIPANASLAAAEVELVGLNGRERKLKEALELAEYDYLIIDCPPALGLLTINALAAADSVLIPVQAEYYALEGLSQLISLIQRVRETINPRLELLGLVLTMYSKRTVLADQIRTELKKHFGGKLLETVVPRNVRLAEAPSFGKTILEHDKWSKGARAYRLLAKEVDKRANTS